MRLQFEVGVMNEEEELATPRRCRPHKSSKSKKGVSQTPREESYRRERWAGQRCQKVREDEA